MKEGGDKMKVQMGKPSISASDYEAVIATLSTGWLTHGPKTHEFEDRFAKYIGVKRAIAMNSCTSALFLAVKALGITGEVIMPSFTFVATANAVVTAGATPVFADIEGDTCNISPWDIEDKITSRTEAIMPVHFAGHPCEMGEIMEIAEKHALAVIEDSAETLGGEYHWQKAGSFGIGCFSFFPTKAMTTGEGGMLTTNDDALADKVRALVGHGLVKTPYERESTDRPWYRIAKYPGYNFRMSEILGVLGYEQLKRLPEMNAKRRKIAAFYHGGLDDLSDIVLPTERENCAHVYQIFTIKVRPPIMRDAFVAKLRKRGVMAAVHFDPPLHHMAIFPDADLPVTDVVSERIVTLPMFPDMTDEQMRYVVGTVKDVSRDA